jgi:hypothetical protein
MVLSCKIEEDTMSKDPGLTARQSFWLGHLRACADGSLKAYAEANGLNVRSLYGAKKRLKRQGVLRDEPPVRLMRVERVLAPAPTLCRVHLPNGAAVEVACAPERWGDLLSRVAALP